MAPDPRVTDPGPAPIDTRMFGTAGSTAAYLIAGPKPALVDAGAASTVDAVLADLAARRVERLDSIVLTHIHFDHAGGAGHLAERFPEAKVYIHERVAPFLTEPEPLIEGVRTVWGDDTERLFGLPKPVPADRVLAIGDGDEIDLGDRVLRAVATPGHTRAHLAFFDERDRAVICGDALGIQIPSSPVMRPATPPADFSFGDALASIEKIRDLDAGSLHVAHFGLAGPDPATACERGAEALTRWHETFLREREYAESDEELLRGFHCALEAGVEPVSPVVRRKLELVNPAWLNVAGMTLEANRLARGRN